MLEVTLTASTFEDMKSAQGVADRINDARYCYGADRQSYEYNLDAQNLVVKNNGRKLREGLGLLGTSLEDLQAPKASVDAHAAAIAEVDSVLESMGVEPCRIVNAVAMFQPYAAYIELEAAGVRFLMSYTKSWSAGTGHRKFSHKVGGTISDSRTHGKPLENWLEVVLDRKCTPPRFLLSVMPTAEVLTDEQLHQRNDFTSRWDSPEGKAREKARNYEDRLTKKVRKLIWDNFNPHSGGGWLSAREQGFSGASVRSAMVFKFNTQAQRDAAFKGAQTELEGFLVTKEDLE